MFKKITEGYVVQIYDDNGNCIEQEFKAGDQVEFTDEEDNLIDVDEYHYQCFEMVQPVLRKDQK